MGKKIKKPDILEDIRTKINQCLEYQQTDPDTTAEKRVSNLRKDPCRSGKYFVNVTLKSAEISETDKMSERKKRIKVKKYLMTNDEIKKIFEAGCIIEVTITDDAGGPKHTISVTAHNSYPSLMGALMPKYFDESCMMQALKPKKPVLGNNYIEDDLKTAREAGKKKIVYSMGRFNLKAVPDLVKEEYDTEKYDVYTFTINNTERVPYVDMTRKTSFEQNVNQFFENVGVMNSVTMFGAKSNLPNYELTKTHAVYDMCIYLNQKMNEIKAGDDALAKNKYKFYSEVRDEVFKDISQARWDQYSNLGGGAWSDWNAAQSQYLTFKSVSSHDLDFKEEALNNGTFKSNVIAYEKAVSLYNNSEFAAMDASWKQETEFFKKQKPGGLQFSENYSGEAKGAATAFIMANMVDPPTVIVKPYGGSQIKFNDNIYYKFCVPAQLGCDLPTFLSAATYTHDERYMILGDPDTVYAKVQGAFKSSNTIPIQRDTIKLEGNDYQYTGVEMKLDEVNNAPYTDEMTHETDIYTVPAESYYNQEDRMFFKADQLDDRFKECQLIYELIPKIVELPYTFVQDSAFETFELAEEREKKVREDWKDKFLRCCVDTINYDPWEVVITKLKKLFCIWCKLGAEDDEYELPPIELTDLTKITCQACGKTMDECKCADFKLCDKCYPLDFYGLTGKNKLGKLSNDILGDKNIYGMFSAAGYVYDQANHPLTYGEIAKAIYQALYPSEEAAELTPEIFGAMNKYSMMIVSTPYMTIRNSPAFQMSGSIPVKLTESDWERFVKEYVAGLKAGKKMHEIKFAKTYRVGVADGYAYIPTGHDVRFDYDAMSQSFTVKGATSVQTTVMESLAFCSEEQYMILYKSVAESCNPLTDDMKKFIAYPFIPSVTSIIEGKIDKIKKPDEYDEDYVFIPDPDDVKHIFHGGETGVVPLRFSIYIKRPVLCSYPMNKDGECRSKDNCGFCGLREMFEKPLIVCSYNFDLEKEVMTRVTRRKRIAMKKVAKDLKENTQFIKDASCNVTKNLVKIDDIKNTAISEVVDFAELHKDLMGLVGKDQSDDSNQDSMLCESIKIENLKSVMLDYDDVFTHTVKTIEVEGDDNFDISKEAIVDMIKDFTTLSPSLKESLFDIALAFPIFNMCQRKFRDYLTEQNIVKSVDVTLIEKAKKEFAKDFINAMKIRLCNSDIKNGVKKLKDLSPSKKEAILDAFKQNDFEDAKSLILANPEIFDPMIKHSTMNDKVLDVIEALTQLDERSSAIYNCLKKAILSNLSPDETSKMEVAHFSDPVTLMKGMALATEIVETAAKLTKNVAKGIEEGINITVDNAVDPLLNLGTADNMGAAQSAIDYAKTTLKATLMAACDPYVSDSTNALAGLAGVGGAFQPGDVKRNAIAEVTVFSTNSVNTLMIKTNIKELVKNAMESIVPVMNKIMKEQGGPADLKENSLKEVGEINNAIGENAKNDVANSVNDNLMNNCSNEVANLVRDSIDEGTVSKLESMRKRVEDEPALNKVVDALLRKDNGEMTDAVMGFVNGTYGMIQDKQNEEEVKKSVEQKKAAEDSLTQVYKFIKDNCRMYQQITGAFITFDS